MREQEQTLTYIVVDRDGTMNGYLAWFSNSRIWWTFQVEKALKFERLTEAKTVVRSLGYLASGELSVKVVRGVKS